MLAGGGVVFGNRGLEEVGVVALGVIEAVMRAAALLAEDAARDDHLGEDEHVAKSAREGERLVRPHRVVAEADLGVTLAQLAHAGEAGLEPVARLHDRARGRHLVAKLLGDLVRIRRRIRRGARRGDLQQGVGPGLLPLHGFVIHAGVQRLGRAQPVQPLADAVDDGDAAEEPVEDAGEQRVGPEARGAVVGEVHLAEGVQPGDVGHHVVGRADGHAAADLPIHRRNLPGLVLAPGCLRLV